MRKLFAYSHTYKNCRKPLINDTYFNPLAITFSYNKAMALHTKGDIKPFDMSRLNTRYYLKIKQMPTYIHFYGGEPKEIFMSGEKSQILAFFKSVYKYYK